MEMKAYLRNYGWHFNKKAYEYAVKLMRTRTKGRIAPISKEDFETLMKKHGITLENDVLYDGAYVYMMAKSDFFESSIPNEQTLAQYVKDAVDDVDAPEGAFFAKWYACMARGGEPIDWEDML